MEIAEPDTRPTTKIGKSWDFYVCTLQFYTVYAVDRFRPFVYCSLYEKFIRKYSLLCKFLCRCLTCLVVFKTEILPLNNMMEYLSKSLVTSVVWVIFLFMKCDECSTTHHHVFLWGRLNLFFKMLSTHTIKLFYFTVIFTVIASAFSEIS
jgi:hypothetical protein